MTPKMLKKLDCSSMILLAQFHFSAPFEINILIELTSGFSACWAELKVSGTQSWPSPVI